MVYEYDKDKHLGRKTLGVFLFAFIVAWFGGALWGVGATQMGRLLHFTNPIISIISLLGIAGIRLIVWVPASHFVLRRPLRNLSFPLHRGWLADLMAGAGITALALLTMFLIVTKAGWLIVEGWTWHSLPLGAFLGKLGMSLLLNTLVALVEEVAFRAYLLTGLKEAWGQWRGLAVMMVVFGLIHLPAYSRQGIPQLLTIVALLLPIAAGGIFGWAYLRTGSLWLPLGIHFAWDFVENDLLNLSGDMTNPHLIGAVAHLRGPSTLAGMEYGNAMVVDALALAIIFALILIWLRNRQRG